MFTNFINTLLKKKKIKRTSKAVLKCGCRLKAKSFWFAIVKSAKAGCILRQFTNVINNYKPGSSSITWNETKANKVNQLSILHYGRTKCRSVCGRLLRTRNASS